MAEDCCCFLFTRRNPQTRPERRRRADARAACSFLRRLAAGHARRQSRPQAARPQLHCTASLHSRRDADLAGRPLECEEIELQCWSLSPDCLLVNSDRRCRLISWPQGHAKPRPLDRLDEGRRHLDRRRPESMSLIKFTLDHQSGQLERRLSIHEVSAQDNEFLELLEPRAPRPRAGAAHEETASACEPLANGLDQQQQRRRLELAEKLASRSFLLIERAGTTPASQAELEQGHTGAQPAASGAAWADTRQRPRENQRGANCGQKCAPHNMNLERELLSSISIETPDGSHLEFRPAVAPALSKHPAKRKRKMLRLNIVRRIYKLISNSSGSSSSLVQSRLATEASLAEQGADDEQACLEGHDFVGASYQQVEFDAHGSPRMLEQEARAPPGAERGQLARLARPHSLYLWPERLAASVSGSTGRFNQRRRPPHIAMISYNHAEAKGYAIALHARLKQLGVGAYLDLYDIRHGEDWQDSLNFAILNCAVFIPLVTPSYGETLWTSRECKLADVLAKRIIPINFGQHWPPASLAIQFATLQFIHWLHLDQDSLAALEPAQSEERAARQRSLPTGPHLAEGGPGAEWPAECVLSCAAQLKKSLQFEPHLQSTQHAAQTPPSGQLHASPLASSRAIKTASPHSDSGYESPPLPSLPPPPALQQQGKRTSLRASAEREATLNMSIQSAQGGRSLSHKLRKLARVATKSGEFAPRSHGALECNESGAGSSDEPNSAELLRGAELNRFKLTPQRPSGERQRDSARHRAAGSRVEHGQAVAGAQRQRPPDGRKQRPQQQQQQQDRRPPKSSLGHKAKKVLSRVRRSMNPAKVDARAAHSIV